MFYSQFILAKKGPLGTIWIAAHLERKLKKNQVADTDIGVSVDSILSPDVPIALRLSSHLLLGVVRIYSRKVNYLFHDCSEALLKIKQAFRSTAVDLPPEESTAPYHSITLPETFDLDDFELPDSAFQGNFVDHHVSTREQITLQDSVDAVGYSTLQFGLDERFGDGDASQIDLVLDENLLLDKDSSLQNASVQLGTDGMVHQGQSSNMNVDGQNEYDGHTIPQSPRDLSELLSDKHIHSTMESSKKNDRSSLRQGYNIQTPDLNEVFFPDDHVDGPSAVPNFSTSAADDAPSPDLYECAEAPCTPGLMEEAIPASVQEIPVFSPQEKTSPSNTVEEVDTGTSISRLENTSPDGKKDSAPTVGVSTNPESAVNGQFVSSFNSSLTEPTIVQECSGELLTASDEAHLGHGPEIEVNVQNVFICNEVNNLPVHDNLEATLPDVACLDDLVSSRCNIEASNTETPLNKSPHTVSPLTSNDNIVAAGMTLDINSTSLENTSLISNGNRVVPGITLDTKDTSHENKAFTSNDTIVVPGMVLDINRISPEDKSLTSNDNILAQIKALDTTNTSDGNKVLASNDVMVTPEITLDVTRISFDNIADSSVQGSQARADDGSTYLTSNTPNLCSDLYLRSCNSLMNQITNILPSEASVEIAPDFSLREPHSVPEATPTDEILQATGSSIELKGEANRTFNVTEAIQTVHQNLGLIFPEPQLGVNKPDKQETYVFSIGTQLNTSNLSSSSEYPEPEKMLFAPTSGVNLPNMFGQTTAELAIVYPGSVETSNLRGKKRHLMDPSPVPQIGSSAKTSGLQRVRRNTAFVPDDDDLLASILVGRTPDLRMGPTPPPTTVASRKKPRLTRNIVVPKRKVLQDDTMVLHADAIRQQLINTEDIRRIRKKAPCTRPEIWMIQKSIMAEEMFGESLLAGISTNFNSLDTRCNVTENPDFQIGDQQSDEHYLYAELSKEHGHCESSEFVMESSGKIVAKPIANIPDRFDDGMQGPSTVSNISKDAIELDVQETQEYHAPQLEQLSNNQTLEVVDIGIQGPSVASLTVEASTCKDAVELFGQEKLESGSRQLEQPSNNQTTTLPMSDINTHEVIGLEMPSISAPFSQDEHEVLAVSGIEDAFIQQNNLNDSCPKENDVLCMQQEQESVHKLIQPSDNHAELGEGIFNLAGTASFEGVASAENATKCNNMALASLDDGKPDQAEDAHLIKNSLDKSNIGDVMNSNCPQYFHADVGNIENGETLVSLLDRCLLKDAAGLPPAHPSPAIDPKNSCLSDMEIKSGELTDLANTSGNQAMEEMKTGDLDVTPENELAAHRVSADDDRPHSVTNCEENPQTSCPYQPDIGSENVPSAVGENSGLHKCNLDGGLDVDSAPMDIDTVRDCDISGPHRIGLDVESSIMDNIAARQSSVPSAVGDGSDLNESNVEAGLDGGSAPVDTVAARESNEFCSAVDDNDTEFLNMDDDAYFDEEADNDVPNFEESQSLENSGWSSRTRGVARFLKTYFDEESGRGRKIVSVDNLLAGKTRKEASRMFFETLVLTTRDYVHVEQDSPFDTINIKPRPKLLKPEL